MADWTFEDGILCYQKQIYVPNNNEVKRQILKLYHDTIGAGHEGQAKTLELVLRGFYWPSMKAFVNRYVEACNAC